MISTVIRTGKAASIPAGLLIASVFSMLTTLIVSAAIAYLLENEQITWQQTGYVIMCLLYISSFLSAKIASAMVKRQRIYVSMMSGLLYWGLLLCTTCLFFGGQYSGVAETFCIIIAGCGTAAILHKSDSLKHRNKYRRGYC